MWKVMVVLVFALSLGSACHSSNYRDALDLAKDLVKSGDKLAAADVLEQALGQDANDDAEWLRGAVLIWRGAPDRLILAQFLKVADRYPSSPNAALALVRVGHLRDRVGDDPSSDWQRVVRDYPQTKAAVEAMHCLGHCALRDHHPALAIKMFKDAMAAPEADADSAADSRVEAGYACISQYWKTRDRNFLVEARETLSPLAASSETKLPVVRAHLGLGEAFLILADGDAAEREYRAALAARPNDPYLLGIAEFGLGSALYTKHDFASAETALTAFLARRDGKTLAEKDQAWRKARPGYESYSATDPDRALALSGLDLVPTAAYWEAASLVELKQYRKARSLVDELQGMPGLTNASRVENLRKVCAHNLGEDK